VAEEVRELSAHNLSTTQLNSRVEKLRINVSNNQQQLQFSDITITSPPDEVPFLEELKTERSSNLVVRERDSRNINF
jgi:hypothetical protein